jgi:hypothetical protein
MLHLFDSRSQNHLRIFAGQVAFVLLISAPALWKDRNVPALFLLELQTMFGLSALVVLAFGVLSRQRLQPGSLCIWDHLAGLLLLKAACGIALELIGSVQLQ